MRYDDMLLGAINEVRAMPKKPAQTVNQLPKNPVNFDYLTTKLIEKLLIDADGKKEAQSINVNYDTKHLESLIEKLQELVGIAPNVTVEAPDHSELANALILQSEQIAKLGRLLTKKQSMTCSVLRDEDGKMTQIIIEKD
jgi:hypothetical protein